MTRPTIVWFRQDLRLADNPALAAAVARGGPVIPLFVLDDAAAGDWRPSGAARWWLGQSLEALDRQLQALGARLIRREGDSRAVLEAVIAESGADAVFWNRRYTPFGIRQDTAIKAWLKDAGMLARSFKAGLVVEPMEIAGRPGSFSAFFTAWRTQARPDAALPVPDGLRTVEVEDLPTPLLGPDAVHWTGKLGRHWQAGEAAAAERLATFRDHGLSGYAKARHVPAADATSGLSPYLAIGAISPMAVLRAISWGQGFAFLRQLAWRDYATFLLYHYPELPEQELELQRRGIPWREAPDELVAWQRGETGFDLVDAGMRQLWGTGWMHNRTRMLVASFLTKHLLIDWRAGQRWFWDTLIDADLANNAMGWQWSASTGADARGIVRVLNPETQAAKFDADGKYRRRWLADRVAPPPIVELESAGKRALEAYAAGGG